MNNLDNKTAHVKFFDTSFLELMKWWEMADSNCRPHACHACALTN